MVLMALSTAANAITVLLVSHNQTSSSGTKSTLITDGSHVSGIAPATTAVWDWDGTTLTATGLYSNVGSIGSSPVTATILSDQIINLSIDTSTATATAASYSCVEGTFLAGVGASGCGGYNLGTNFIDESTTVWGPGLAISQTLGGDDVLTGTPRSVVSAYDFGNVQITGTGLHVGDELLIGNGVPFGQVDPVEGGGEVLTFSLATGAVDDVIGTAPGLAVDVPVLVNDVLDDSLGEDIVNLAAPANTAPQHGFVTVQGALPGPRGSLSIRYTPDVGYVGPDTFDYTVTDKTASATGTVNVTVTTNLNANDDGTANKPFATVLAGQTVTLDVLANDTGLFDTPLTLVSPLAMAPASPNSVLVTGAADASSLRIEFAAGPNPGKDSFDYQVSDNGGKMDSAKVFVEVLPLNIPVANDDTVTLVADEPGFVAVLANDKGLGDTPLNLTITRDPARGAIGPVQLCEQQGSCKVWYTPEAGFIGNDSFQYTVTDATNETSNVANVTIAVVAPARVPVAVDDQASTTETQAANIDVLKNDSPDGLDFPPVAVTISTAPVNGGTAVVQADNSILYTPPAGGGVGSDTFEYTATDNKGNASAANVRVTIVLKQAALPGGSSALGAVGLGLLLPLAWLRRRRRFLPPGGVQ